MPTRDVVLGMITIMILMSPLYLELGCHSFYIEPNDPEITTRADSTGLADTPIPCLGIDPQHSFRSKYTGPRISPTEVQRFKLNANNQTSFCLGLDGTIYICDSSQMEGGVYAFYPNGTLRWKYQREEIQSFTKMATLSSDGYLYATYGLNNPPEDFGLVKINCSTGKEIWSVPVTGFCRVAPLLGDDGNIYFGGDEDIIRSIGPDGVSNWQYQFGQDDCWIWCDPVMDDDGVIYSGGRANAFAIRSDGQLVWSDPFRSTYPPTVLDNDIVTYLSETGDIRAYYTSNGTVAWERNFSAGYFETAGAVSKDGRNFLVTLMGEDYQTITLYSLKSHNGEINWSYKFNGFCNSPTVDSEGIIYITESQAITALQPNGSVLWRKTFDHWPGQMVITGNGIINYLLNTGRDQYLVTAVEDPEGEWEEDSWFYNRIPVTYGDDDDEVVVDDDDVAKNGNDTDHDSLPDEWEIEHFGNLSQNPSDDFDNDGISNYDEFVNNTDPADHVGPEGPSDMGSGMFLFLLIPIILISIIIIIVIIVLKRNYTASDGIEDKMANEKKAQRGEKKKIGARMRIAQKR